MQPGDTIRLRAYGGEEIERRVVGVKGDVVVVCRDEEYQKARKEGREPITVGFRIDDVLQESVG
jgi:hypothetical protein